MVWQINHITLPQLWFGQEQLEIAKVDAITALINHRADVNAVSGAWMSLSWIPGSHLYVICMLLYICYWLSLYAIVRFAASQPFPRSWGGETALDITKGLLEATEPHGGRSFLGQVLSPQQGSSCPSGRLPGWIESFRDADDWAQVGHSTII